MELYNNGFPVSIDNMLNEEKATALKSFAEGSLILEECLVTLNRIGLTTNACCRGHHEIEDENKFISYFLIENELDLLALSRCFCPPYISFSDNSEVFSYLSAELINNPKVYLLQSNGACIYFYGGENNEYLMESFLKDIKSGKKENSDFLLNKINQPLSADIYYNSYMYGLLQSGFSEKNISVLKLIMGLNACRKAKLSTYEEVHEFCLIHGINGNDEITILNELNISMSCNR